MRTLIHIINRILAAPFRAIRWLWRHITPEGAKKARDFSFIILAIGVLFLGLQNAEVLSLLQQDVAEGQQRGIQNRQTLQEIERLANLIESQTSPEAQRRQEETIDQIITIIGCDNQDTIQRLVDVLVERQVLEAGVLEVITAECELILASEP